MTVTLIVPTLNELEGLKTMMPKVKHEWYDQCIFLIGKPKLDDCDKWCLGNGYEVFYGEENLWNGYRNLFLSGKVKGDIVVVFSPDGNSIPEAIPELVAKVKEGFHLVIASRYKNGLKSPDDTKLTKVGNNIFTGMINFNSRFKYTDALVMFRAYRTNIVDKLGLTAKPNILQRQLIKMSGLYSWEPSMSIRASETAMCIAEIPAIEPKAFRVRRQNTLIHGLAIGLQILHEQWLR